MRLYRATHVRASRLGFIFIPLVLLASLAACSLTPASSASRAVSGTATATPTHTSQVTYVALGASDAYGIGTQNPARDNWPTVLVGMLGPTVHLINLGIPGVTLVQAEESELSIAIDQHPDIITVWLAVNDLADHVKLNTYDLQLRSLLTMLRDRTHARVYVGNVPDLTLLPAFSGADPTALSAEVQQWNAVIAADCRADGAQLVDLYSGWSELASHPEYIASDGFHPSTTGAARLAAIFAAAIRRSPSA